MAASYNNGNFEILGIDGQALRLSRAALGEVRLGTLADKLYVTRWYRDWETDRKSVV